MKTVKFRFVTKLAGIVETRITMKEFEQAIASPRDVFGTYGKRARRNAKYAPLDGKGSTWSHEEKRGHGVNRRRHRALRDAVKKFVQVARGRTGTGTKPGLRIRDAELRRVKATCCLPATVRDGDRQDEEHDIED